MAQNDNIKLANFNNNKALKANDVKLAVKGDTTSIYLSEINKAEKAKFPKISKFYILSDVVALLLGFAVALTVAFAINSIFMGRGEQFLENAQMSSFVAVSFGLILYFINSGHYRVRMPFWLEAQKIVSSFAFAMLVDGFLQFASKQDISRLLVISGWAFAAVITIAMRALVRKFATKKEIFQVPTLLVGAGATAQQARASIESAPEMGYKIVAQIKNLPEAFLQAGSSWAKLCEIYSVQNIIIALDGQDFVGTEKIVAKLAREAVPFSVVPPLQHLPVAGMMPQYFLNHNTMLLTYNSGLEQTLPTLAKRALDVVVSGAALVVLSPVMLVLVALVRRDGGSAFFGHKRIGRDGKMFACLKFRSMVMGGDAILKKHLEENPEAAAEWKATQKLQNDPRVTKLGKFLRASSLDELPQLINVLRGDMSLVGPRPIVKDEVAHYKHNMDYYHRVRPGVTGLWQVSGRNDVSYEQRVQMDSWYVRNWSLWHDIAIICKTFPAVFKRSGAY